MLLTADRDGIDFLRGLVLAIMVLDHARDFFGGSSMNARDVHDAGLFVTGRGSARDDR